MITLTEQQRRELAANSAGPPRAVDPDTRVEYVLLRADVYDSWRAIVADDTAFTAAETLDRVMAEDDADDPYLAELQRKYGGVQE